MTAMKLRIDQIRTDGGTQPRSMIDSNTVREYAESLQNEAQFPPVTVFYDGSDYWLADGFHRVHAHKYLDWLEIDADVKQGTMRDAQWYSLSANQTHGLRRTRADVERAIKFALLHPEVIPAEANTNRGIARHIGCSHNTVEKFRGELVASGQIDQMAERQAVRNGTPYAIDVSNIGKRPNIPMPQPETVRVEYETPMPPPEDDDFSFTCGTCHDRFFAVVSHCSNCGHHYPPEYGDCRNCYQQLPAAVDGVTGEVYKAEQIDEEPKPAPQYPPELLEAAHRPMSPAPYQLPTLEQAQTDSQIEELRRLLQRLMQYKDKVSPKVLADDLVGAGVLELARYASEMLAGWLTIKESADQYVIDADPILTPDEKQTWVIDL